MKHLHILAALCAIITSAACGGSGQAGKAGTESEAVSVKADRLVLGNIITVNEYKPVAEAFTVKDGIIQFVGSEAGARAMCDGHTEVLDFSGNYVYPGFLEAHAHGLGAGVRMVGQADLTAGKTVEDYLRILKEWVDSHPDKELISGGGWAPWAIEEPTKEMIDAVCPDKPVILQSVDGHSMWVNSRLLEQQHIDREYAAKMGPEQVHVDADGNPTGLLTEGATTPLMAISKFSVDDFKKFILAWQDFAFSKGYTCAAEAGVELAGQGTKQAYSELGAEGRLKLRTYAYHLVADASRTPEADVAAAVEDVRLYNNEYFKVVGMKVFIDGVIEAHTGWLLDDYADQPGYHGLERYNDHGTAVRLIEEADRHGLSVHAHTIGDGAVRFMLDAIEEASRVTGDFDQRNILVHLQLVDPADYVRFADYGVIAGTAPLWTPKFPGTFSQECSYVGEERAERAYPIKSIIDAGIVNVSHTDYPVSTQMGIPLTFYEGVMRSVPGGGKELQRGPGEVMSRMDVLKSMTANVAYLWREEGRLGSIEVGKIANATVFDKNFLTDPIEEIPGARLVATVVDGNIVYSAK